MSIYFVSSMSFGTIIVGIFKRFLVFPFYAICWIFLRVHFLYLSWNPCFSYCLREIFRVTWQVITCFSEASHWSSVLAHIYAFKKIWNLVQNVSDCALGERSSQWSKVKFVKVLESSSLCVSASSHQPFALPQNFTSVYSGRMIHEFTLFKLGYAAIQENIFWFVCNAFDLVNLVTQIHRLHSIYHSIDFTVFITFSFI